MHKSTSAFIWLLAVVSINVVSTTDLQSVLWHAEFSPNKTQLNMETTTVVNLTLTGLDMLPFDQYELHIISEKTHLASAKKVIYSSEVNRRTGEWKGNFSVAGNFLGTTKIYVDLVAGNFSERSVNYLDVIIIRKVRIIDHIFTGSVALLVSLLYINFGAALDLHVLKGILKRPIGPAIGFIMQFLLMPLISFGLGYALFPHSPEMHLGLFFTGVSPGGGASNIWTVLLQGNINLSIAMTTISNFAAFGMMPLWLFTLGKMIFDRGQLSVPYDKIATFAISLVIPLAIGIAIQKYLPRVSRVLVRLLKPVSAILILFIVIFAIVTNLYLFELFSWQIIIAGLGLPWIGYSLSWIAAKLLKQTTPDVIAIAVETGIQNTGISIFLLRFTLDQPQADLTTVIPVAVAIMTPVPLFLLYLCMKLRSCKMCKEGTEKEHKRIMDQNSSIS